MTRFEECLKVILASEGGYVCHPNDRGGSTNKGITQKTLDEWCDKIKMPRLDVKHISDSAVADVYRWQYWAVCKCGSLPKPIDLVVFDSAVNHGVRRAGKLLQEALDITVDGVIGPMTVNAAKREANRAYEIALSIIGLRAAFYDSIVDRDPSQQVFAKGWRNRLSHLTDRIRQLSPGDAK